MKAEGGEMNRKPAILEVEEKLSADTQGKFLNDSVSSMESYARWIDTTLNKGTSPNDYTGLMQLKECTLLAIKIFQETWTVMHGSGK
jgi:hypothetical protein